MARYKDYNYDQMKMIPISFEQQIHVIAIEEYVYLVPFVETDEEVFLKTIIPSRKATRDYLGERK